jgi:hypothetical protein
MRVVRRYDEYERALERLDAEHEALRDRRDLAVEPDPERGLDREPAHV